MILFALAQTVVLSGATVHTQVQGERPVPATIVIEGDRIRAVGRDVAVPEGAKVIDASGMHVIPGLVDGLVHLDADHDLLYLDHGITLVRDAGNELGHILSERDDAARDRHPGPAIWVAGAVLDGPEPSTTAAVILASAEEAAEKLPRLFDLELDYLSFHLGLGVPAWHKVLELAHARELQVWGPRLPSLSLEDALAAGQDGFFHLDALLPAGGTWDQVTKAELEPAIAAFARSKAKLSPALGVRAVALIAPKESPPELAYLGPIYASSWLIDAERRKAAVAQNPELLKVGLRALNLQSEVLKALHDQKVALVPASGSPNPWLFPGEALVDELELWARAGIPSADLVRLATRDAARALGIRGRGTIEAGEIADLVVLAKDPTADVSNLRTLEHVVVRGQALSRAELAERRERVATVQKRRQANAFKPVAVSAPEPPPGVVLLRGTAETRTVGQRISGESWIVTRREDGSTVYQTHMLTLGSASTSDTELELSQTIGADDDLAGFELVVRAGARVVTVKGIPSAGLLNVERRVDGVFVDNVPQKDRVALVDVGSALTGTILGHHRAAGRFKVIYFEDFEPAVATWEQRVDAQGTHVLRTHSGAMKFALDERGAVQESQREQGRGVLVLKTGDVEAPEGRGLPRRAPAGATTAPAKPPAPGGTKED